MGINSRPYGKCPLLFIFNSSGGIGGFVLAIFHKFEISKKPIAQKVREFCPLLRRTTDPVSYIL